MTEEESFLSYVFPLLRFHSRWKELSAEDFTYLFSKPTLSHNGYLMQTGVVPKGFLRDFKRCAYYVCRKALKSDLRRIVVMSGARRTGKTTVIYQTIADLLNEGVKPRNILFFTSNYQKIVEFQNS